MTNTALVVGCDDYPHLPGAAATGAVADALAVRTWLLDHGGVARRNLRLLLSPAAGDAVDHGAAVDGPAELSSLCAETRRLLTTGTGDRLYVYLTGHGCLSDDARPFVGRRLVLLSDFHPSVGGTGSLAVDELTAHLTHADFREVILVVDCGPGVPVDGRVRPGDLGGGWLGRRTVGAAIQFRMQAPAEGDHAAGSTVPAQPRGALTAAFLTAVRGASAATAGSGDGIGGQLQWAAVERQVRSAMPAAVTVDGPDPGMTLASTPPPRSPLPLPAARAGRTPTPPPTPAPTPAPMPPTRTPPNPRTTTPPTPTPPKPTPAPAPLPAAVAATAGRALPEQAAAGTSPAAMLERTGIAKPEGEVDLRSDDPNAMLMVEDAFGIRRAVGVGAIAGRLPAGSYTAVLADPCGTDPRLPISVTPRSTARVVLSPPARTDGFRVTDHPALRWSSPAAQLAMTTTGLWAYGHQSFLLVGVSPAVPGGPVLLDDPDRFPANGTLTTTGDGWWVALPVNGLWHRLALGGRVLTVPAAPDSVTAVAISTAAIDVALFDTTHPEPSEIAAQDRVQEYLAIGRLGAADLTSRSAVHAGRRWPWGASAAVRRLIDRTRAARAGERQTHDRTVDLGAAAPPHEFRADVPPVLRSSLVGRGPWAVWLDWPVSRRPAERQRLPAPVPAAGDRTRQ